MSYTLLARSTSDCVHFVYSDEVDEADFAVRETLRKLGVRVAYVDYSEAKRSEDHIVDLVARALSLEHAPYGPRTSPYQPKVLVPFLDDLGSLSLSASGAVIVIDNANEFLTENSRDMFELIEAFLIQSSQWYEKKKPCHLCFQMEKSEWVRRIFAPASPAA